MSTSVAGRVDQRHVRSASHGRSRATSASTATVTKSPAATDRYRGEVLSAAAVITATATNVTSASAHGDTADGRTARASSGAATRNKKSSPQPVDNSNVA